MTPVGTCSACGRGPREIQPSGSRRTASGLPAGPLVCSFCHHGGPKRRLERTPAKAPADEAPTERRQDVAGSRTS